MQQDLTLEPPTPKKPRHVRQVSVQQYAAGRDQFTGRKADVLRWLAGYTNRYVENPTSGELAQWGQCEVTGKSWDWILLFVRRGLSDLQKAGVIEAAKDGQRKCGIMGSLCETWRVKLVGR